MPRFAPVALLLLAAWAFPTLGDTVYVVSFTTGELVRYDSADLAGTKTVLSGSGSLAKPAAVAVGPDGSVYIGENGDGSLIAPRISRFEPATATLSPVVTFGAFDVFPGSLAFKGNDLLVGRNPFYSNKGPIVRVANAGGGGPIAVSAYTSGGGLASSPGLALGADGRLYVADQTYSFATGTATGSVKEFDAAGLYVGEVIASGSAGLAGPTGLVLTGSTLYTASIMTGGILRTDLAAGSTAGFVNLSSPFAAGALALLSDGSLLTGSPSGSGFIYRVGTVSGTYASGLGQIGGIATVAAVPEPAAPLLVAMGLVATGLLVVRRRSRPQ